MAIFPSTTSSLLSVNYCKLFSLNCCVVTERIVFTELCTQNTFKVFQLRLRILGFFPSIYCAGNRWEKAGSVIHNMDREIVANIRCLSHDFCFGVPETTALKDKRFDSAVIWKALEKESFYGLTKTIAHFKGFESEIKLLIPHVINDYSVKTESTESLSSLMYLWSGGVFWRILSKEEYRYKMSFVKMAGFFSFLKLTRHKAKNSKERNS